MHCGCVRTSKATPGLNFSVKSYFESADRLKSMADLEGAELFFGHDEQQWKEKGGRWYK